MAYQVTRCHIYRLTRIGTKISILIYLSTFSAYALSGNWLFSAQTKTALSYVDNINLAPDNAAESSNVFELTPGFSLTGKGKRLQAKINYSVQGLYYSNNPLKGGGKDSKYYNHLSASMGSELLEQLLYFDASAGISQESSSIIGKGTLDNYSISNDRGTVRRTMLSPYLHRKLVGGIDTELRYRDATLNSDKQGIVDDSTVQTTSLILDSDKSLERWKWRLKALNSDVHYKTKPDLTNYNADFGLSYHLTDRTIVNLNGGTEKVKYHPSSLGEAGGDYWLVGLDLKPGRRTFMTLKAGKRYYGNTYGLSFKHVKRKSALGIDYSEDVTNTSSIQLEQQATFIGITTNSNNVAIPVYVIQTYPVLTNDVIVRKTLNGNLVWNTGKTTTTILLSKIKYDYQQTNIQENIETGQIGWNWHAFDNVTFNAQGYARHRKIMPADEYENLGQIELNITRTLNKYANIGLSVVRTGRNTTISTSDYSQKRLTLSLNMKW